jgi:hypothetical protein
MHENALAAAEFAEAEWGRAATGTAGSAAEISRLRASVPPRWVTPEADPTFGSASVPGGPGFAWSQGPEPRVEREHRYQSAEERGEPSYWGRLGWYSGGGVTIHLPKADAAAARAKVRGTLTTL